MDIKTAMNLLGLKPAQVQSMTLKDLTAYNVKKRQEIINSYDASDEAQVDEMEDKLADLSDAFVALKDTFNVINTESNEVKANLPDNFFPQEFEPMKVTQVSATSIPLQEQQEGNDYPCFLGGENNPNLAFLIPTKLIPDSGKTVVKGITSNGKLVNSTINLVNVKGYKTSK